jgi:Uma2 family endonuclease
VVCGVLVVRLALLVGPWVEQQGLGLVLTETGFILVEDPDTVRAPDLAFVAGARVPAGGVPRGFWIGPPDLAVEVLSPDDRAAGVRDKVDDYLTHGVRLVWVVDPDAQTITSYRRWEAPVTTGVDGTLDGGEVVPGLKIALEPLFA